MPVAAPADKRFRRAHVHPARRRAWRPAWRTLLVGAVVSLVLGYGLYRGAVLAMRTDALAIADITVSGTARMSPGEVLALLEGLRGANVLTTDLEEWRQKLLGSPWVADAEMRRVFPGTVAVAITEREPLGIGRIGDALYLIDRRGAVIDEFGPNYADVDLPIIDGLAARPGQGLVDQPRAQLAGRLLADFQRRPDLARRLSQIDVSDTRDAVVLLEGDPAMLRVGHERFVERVQAYLDLAERLREQIADIDYVDMRFDERVYVRPQGVGSKGARRTGGS